MQTESLLKYAVNSIVSDLLLSFLKRLESDRVDVAVDMVIVIGLSPDDLTSAVSVGLTPSSPLKMTGVNIFAGAHCLHRKKDMIRA